MALLNLLAQHAHHFTGLELFCMLHTLHISMAVVDMLVSAMPHETALSYDAIKYTHYRTSTLKPGTQEFEYILF